MHNTIHMRRIFLFGLIAAAMIALLSCTALKTVGIDEPEIALDGVYRKVIIQRFDLDPQLAKTHPEAAAQCENAALQEMMNIGAVPQIEKAGDATLRQRYAVVLKAYLRGGQSGPAFSADVRLIDAYTGKTLRQATLPGDSMSAAGPRPKRKTADVSAQELGVLIGEYVSTAVSGEAADR
ncbi:MAG TPA: hypothetical protein PK090_04390 [Smithellaceae bacterium]|jgi:hypothetical protein|nr:hypothetical protein [Smithellaceae bacterium]